MWRYFVLVGALACLPELVVILDSHSLSEFLVLGGTSLATGVNRPSVEHIPLGENRFPDGLHSVRCS